MTKGDAVEFRRPEPPHADDAWKPAVFIGEHPEGKLTYILDDGQGEFFWWPQWTRARAAY